MRRLAAALVALSGGCGAPAGDACAPYPGQTCVALLLDAPAGAAVTIDQLELQSATDGFPVDQLTPAQPKQVALPVTVAIVPRAGFRSDFSLLARGLLAGKPIDSATVSGTLAPGQHLEVEAVLAPLDAADGGAPGG